MGRDAQKKRPYKLKLLLQKKLSSVFFFAKQRKKLELSKGVESKKEL